MWYRDEEKRGQKSLFLIFFCHRPTAPRLDQNPGKHAVVLCALDCCAGLSLQGGIEGCVHCTVLHCMIECAYAVTICFVMQLSSAVQMLQATFWLQSRKDHTSKRKNVWLCRGCHCVSICQYTEEKMASDATTLSHRTTHTSILTQLYKNSQNHYVLSAVQF